MSSNFLDITFSLSHEMFIIFVEEVSPLIISTEFLAKPRRISSILITALLALPLSGGAFTFILSVSSSQPTIQSFEEEGMTFI